nr:PspC domain-containing protein [Propionibacterium sp.]
MNHLPVLRDSRRRVLGGVCAGLARAWQVDPLLVRAAAVVVAVVTSGLGVFIYLALWLALPLDVVRRGPRTSVRVLVALALLVLVAGVTVPQSRGATFGFAILAALALLWYAAGRAGRPTPSAPQPLEPGAPQWRQPPGWAAFPASPPQVAPVRARRRPIWPPVLLAVLGAWGGLALLAAGGVLFAPVAYPAAALAVIGLALVAAARPGGPRRPRGLVAGGLVASLATMTMLLPATGDPAPSYRTITSAAELAEPIEVGVGTHTVDLSTLTLDADADATITEDAGRLTVVLPRHVNVRSRYVIGMGQLRTPQHWRSGMDTDHSEAYLDAPGRPTLHITIRADVGDVEVRR